MSVDAVFNFYIDLTRDGDYADADENVSAYVKRAEWQLGFMPPMEAIARDGTLSITLNNASGKFSPEGGSALSGFKRGRVVKIESVYSAVTRRMMTAWMKSARPAPFVWGSRETILDTEGYFSRTQRTEAFVPVQQSVTGDVVIEAILSNSLIYPPGFSGRWLLGVLGFGELGQNTVIGATSDYLDADVGKTTFNYIGDEWQEGVSVYSALREVAGREYGYIFLNRNGVLEFWNRHHLLLETTSQATFTNTMIGIDYAYGETVINRVNVKAAPRTASGSAVTLGQLDKATKIEAGSSKEISFRYTDTSYGAKIAGKNAVAPVQTTDFTANSSEDGSGTNYTTSVTTAITDESSSRATVRFTNSAAVDVWLQVGAKIRGTKITSYPVVDVVRTNSDSISEFGYNDYTYPFTMDSVADAEALADYLLNRYKQPFGVVRSMTLSPRRNDALMTQALTRTVGDRISIVETQTGVSADYFIVGERHIVDQASKVYQVTWYLEPADPVQYWVLGVTGFSELEQTTRIAPL